MEEKKGKILKGQFPVSIFYILFGLCLALMPVETVNVLCKVVFGLVLIGAGLYHIFLFVMEKENATVLDLFSGVIVLVIGAFLFMNPQVVIKLLTLMLGAFILVDSIWMLRGSLKLKKRGMGVWKAFLLAGLLFIGLGIMLLVNPFSELKLTMQVAGWIFVANGGLDIIFYFIYRHGMKKEIPAKETENQEKEKLEPEKAPEEEPAWKEAQAEKKEKKLKGFFGKKNTAERPQEWAEDPAETVENVDAADAVRTADFDGAEKTSDEERKPGTEVAGQENANLEKETDMPAGGNLEKEANASAVVNLEKDTHTEVPSGKEEESGTTADLKKKAEPDTAAGSDKVEKKVELSDAGQSLAEEVEEVLEEWKD